MLLLRKLLHESFLLCLEYLVLLCQLFVQSSSGLEVVAMSGAHWWTERQSDALVAERGSARRSSPTGSL